MCVIYTIRFCTIWSAWLWCVFKGDYQHVFHRSSVWACWKLYHLDLLRHHKCGKCQTVHDGTNLWSLPVLATFSDLHFQFCVCLAAPDGSETLDCLLLDLSVKYDDWFPWFQSVLAQRRTVVRVNSASVTLTLFVSQLQRTSSTSRIVLVARKTE